MAEKETLSYLESELASQIKSHDSSRQFYRSANFYICLMTAVFSGTTTVLIGIGQALNGDKIFAILSLIFSGAVTVVAAYDGFLRSKDLWIQNTDTWVGLSHDASRSYSRRRGLAAQMIGQVPDLDHYSSPHRAGRLSHE